MKRKEIKNQKLVSALTIGISAMMFLQTPISAYANDLNTDEPDNGNNASDTTDQGTAVSDSEIVSSAQESASSSDTQTFENTVNEVIEQAVAAENAIAPAGNAQEPGNDAAGKSEDAADVIINGDAEKGVEAADPQLAPTAESKKSIEGLVEAAENVKNETDANADTAVNNLGSAKENVSEASKNLKEAIDADKEAQEAYDSAYTNAENPYGDTVKAFKEAADQMEGDFGILKTAENMEGTVKDANDKAKELIEKIENAGSVEEAQKNSESLSILLRDSSATLKSQIELFNALSEKLEQAVSEMESAQERLESAEINLDNAEKAVDDKLEDAAANAQKAGEDVAAAKQKVDNLAEALDAVKDSLPESGSEEAQKLDDTRKDAWNNVFRGDWTNSVPIFQNVVINYYMPEVIAKENGINLIKGGTVTTEDGQTIDATMKFKRFGNQTSQASNRDCYESKYSVLEYWYYDEDGKPQKGEKYFNWDSLGKASLKEENHNQKGGELGIVIYEKSADELIASKAAENFYRNNQSFKCNGKWLTHRDVIENCTNLGWLRVYTYVDDNGDTQYVTQGEVVGGTYTGEETPLQSEFTKNGKTYELTLFSEGYNNQNGLYKSPDKANCLIIGDNAAIKDALEGTNKSGRVNKDYVYKNVVTKYGIKDNVVSDLIAGNKAFNDFITNNSTGNVQKLISQYSDYTDEVNKAQTAVKTAQEEVANLNSAINTLKSTKSRSPKTQIAREVLGIEDVASYFGIELSEEDADKMNNMTMSDLIRELISLKKDANDKKLAAEANFKDVEDKQQEAQDALRRIIEKYRVPGETQDQDSSGRSGGGSAADADSSEVLTVVSAAPSVSVAVSAAGGAQNVNVQGTLQASEQGAVQTDSTTDQNDVQSAGQTMAIPDQGVALSDGSSEQDIETAGAATIVSTEDTSDQELSTSNVSIDDEDVALAMDAETGSAHKMNWWWILIVAALGTTGKKMYEEHMRKKEEKDID